MVVGHCRVLESLQPLGVQRCHHNLPSENRKKALCFASFSELRNWSIDSEDEVCFHLSMGNNQPVAHGGAAAVQQQLSSQKNSQQKTTLQSPNSQQVQGADKFSRAISGAEEHLLNKPVETVPTAFKWIHPGQEVYLTGSFNSWQGKILMYKQEDGEFALIIDIPPGIHHYKYIVDGEWRLDEDAPTVIHNGVENNIVEVKRPVFEYTPASYADSDDEDGEAKLRAPYGQRAPLSSDYVQEPPRMPPHLLVNILNSASPHDSTWLPVPQHVQINHLYILDGTESNVLVTGITQRFKPNKQTRITHKFVTTIYYTPSSSQKTFEQYSPFLPSSHSYGQGFSLTGSNPTAPVLASGPWANQHMAFTLANSRTAATAFGPLSQPSASVRPIEVPPQHMVP